MKKFLLACRQCGVYSELGQLKVSQLYKIEVNVDYFDDEHSVKVMLICKGCGAKEVLVRKRKLMEADK